MHEKLFGEYWVLWYAISNSYSVNSPEFKLLLDSYLASSTQDDFLATLSDDVSNIDKVQISEALLKYLKDCNRPTSTQNKLLVPLDSSKRHISKHYNFGDKTVQIYFDSELVLKTIHPAISQYCIENYKEVHTTFDIYLENDELCLFMDEQLISCVPKKDYHHIQGKFIMQLLCTLHNKTEQDWIGTLHGSTITDGESSILFVGKSGKGKSTLCALLASNGFDLLADDVSPILSENEQIYYNPSAISIKKGAFDILQPIVNNFETLPVVNFNKSKGNLKYVPCVKPKKDHYPCRSIILVNYTPNSKTKLEDISVKEILETIIEDSWLSPNPKHAKQFLNWLKDVKLYKLTYSDTASVSSEISELFKGLNKLY
jgi:hypothetical protein